MTGVQTCALPILVKTIFGIGEDSKTSFEGINWTQAGYGASFDIGSGMYDGAWQVSGASSYITSIAATAGQADGYSTGYNVVAGIANGMQGALALVQSVAWTVVNTVTTALTGIRGFNINSPSKLMRDEVGKPISEGIADGILKGAGFIDDAITGVKDMTVSGFDDTLDGTTYNVAEQSPITINVYPSAGMDERGLADMVQQRLALAQRQKQAAWGY